MLTANLIEPKRLYLDTSISPVRAVTRNLLLGGRPGTGGGHSLLNKDFAKNFQKIYIKYAQKFRIFRKIFS